MILAGGVDMAPKLHAVVGQFGPGYVADALGKSEAVVLGVVGGRVEPDEDFVDRLVVLCRMFEGVVDWSKGLSSAAIVGGAVAGVAEEGAEGSGTEVEVGEGVLYDPVAGSVEDLESVVAKSPLGVPAPGLTAGERESRRRDNLWAAREVALMSQASLVADEKDLLYAMGVVNQIELALIMVFGESVPDRNRPWDSFRRQKEIYIRMVRRNRIQRDLKRETSGLKGFLNSVRGKKPLTAKELYARMQDYVDDMMSIGDEVEIRHNVLDGMKDFMEGGPMMRRSR